MIPDKIMHASTLGFTLGELVHRRKSSEERAHWPGEELLLGHRLPPFQRPRVWTGEQQVRFVESAWLGLHLGTYVVNKCDRWVRRPDGTSGPHRTDLWLIDGQQRLTAVDAFLGDRLEVFGARWSTLERPLQRRFEDLTFACSFVHHDDEAVLQELYRRLNFGGTPHVPVGKVLVDSERLAVLEDSAEKLACLEAGGVDNWEWYDASLEDYRSKRGD